MLLNYPSGCCKKSKRQRALMVCLIGLHFTQTSENLYVHRQRCFRYVVPVIPTCSQIHSIGSCCRLVHFETSASKVTQTFAHYMPLLGYFATLTFQGHARVRLMRMKDINMTPIYCLLLVFNSNPSPLRDIRLRNMSDLDNRPFMVTNHTIRLPIYAFLL